MAYKTIKTTQEVTAVDIATMQNMSPKDYAQYVRFGLTLFDTHFFLRSGPAEYPIACTKDQLSEYIAYLNEIKEKMD